MLKERMTPDELALLTGYSRQTINKWVRKQGWKTSPKPGVQGGRARLIHIDDQVRDFIHRARRTSKNDAAPQTSLNDTPFEQLVLVSVKEMTEEEQKQFASLLLRDGVSGLLSRLGMRNSN